MLKFEHFKNLENLDITDLDKFPVLTFSVVGHLSSGYNIDNILIYKESKFLYKFQTSVKVFYYYESYTYIYIINSIWFQRYLYYN